MKNDSSATLTNRGNEKSRMKNEKFRLQHGYLIQIGSNSPPLRTSTSTSNFYFELRYSLFLIPTALK